MNRSSKFVKTLFVFILFSIFGNVALADAVRDSTRREKRKSNQRYFRPTFYTNGYTTPKSPIQENSNVTGNYQYSHFNAGYLVPLFTENWYRKKDNTLANFHILTGANFLRSYPEYTLIPLQYSLYKISWGMRLIYNSGRKNVWFGSINPFFSQDDRTIGKPQVRYAASLIFNRMVNKNFTYRLGMYRTYILGGSQIHFPMIGIRIGPLDGTYFSLQFPKYAAFVVPASEKVSVAFFVRPAGNIFNFSEFAGKTDVVQFRRYELLYGALVNFKANKNISMNMGAGFTRSRTISFADNTGATGNDLFQHQLNVEPSLFFTAGLVIRFGKSIPIHNNYLLYDAIDLNQGIESGDVNEGVNDTSIPSKNVVPRRFEMYEIQDLLSEDDIF